MDKIIKRRSLCDHVKLPNTLHPVIKKILAAREVKNIKELDYSMQNLLPYHSLLDITKAVTLLSEALQTQARIIIIADYDVDGATSCVVALKALRQMGGQKVDFVVPHREKNGYGLTPDIVKHALRGDFLRHTPPGTTPDLLITVDNGISSIAGVETAKQEGMRVLITDHHLPGNVLPAADAIVNPRQDGDNFPSKHLCGVGVIFYVMMALRAHLRESGWFTTQKIPEPKLALLLDLVALGTVADVVPLDYNNRLLIAQGLQRIRTGICCPGILALLEISKCDQYHIMASDFGFKIGPRLNAAGRLDDISYSIACLLSHNILEARQHAELLETFNQERLLLQDKMLQEALKMIAIQEEHHDIPIGLCLLNKKWHQGIIGILASRIKEDFHRPVIIFTYDKNDCIRGSGRSVEKVHLREILASIHMKHPNMIVHFGGHAMAAGLTILQTEFEAFQDAFDAEVRQYLFRDDLKGIIESDGTLSKEDFNLEFAKTLSTLTPWGQNFPEPIFEGEFELRSRRILKDKHLKMQVCFPESTETVDAIAFNTLDTDWPANVTRVKLAYKLSINRFRGAETVQCLVEHVVAL